jgi:Zinc-binding dehydrogenase
VLVGGSGGKWFMGTGRALRAVLVSPFVGQRLRSFLSKPRGADLVVLKELIEAGKITPVIDRTFPLNATPEAIRYVGERSTQGKNCHHRVREGPPLGSRIPVRNAPASIRGPALQPEAADDARVAVR